MTAGWPSRSLGELVQAGELSYGIVQPGNDQANGVPIVRVKDIRAGRIRTDAPLRVAQKIEEKYSRTRLRGGELLVSLVGSVGESAPVSKGLEGWNVARAIAVIRPNEVTAEWLHLCMQTLDAQRFIDSVLNTTVQATLNLADLRRLPIPMPPEPVRRAIAEVLGALDDKIAANDRAAKAADQLIHAAYRRLTQSVTARAPLIEVLDVDFGEAFKGDQFGEPGSGRPLIRIRDLKTFSPQIWTTESRAREVVVSPGDVLVGMDAEFRPTWWLGDPGLLNQRVCRVRGKTTGAAFVKESLGAPLEAIESEKSGTTVIHLNKSDLVRATIASPEPGDIARFEDLAEPVMAARVTLARECRLLASTRDELLPLLMSGKVRVSDAERVVSDVS